MSDGTRDSGIGGGTTAGIGAGRFALLLGALICAAFPELVTGQGTFFHRDFGLFTYPVAFMQRESFWRGEMPLWNPLSYCGIPFLAQWNTSILYPPALFYLVFPLSWSLGIFTLAHLFLAGMGMFFLARRWTGDSTAAAAAGVIFAFNALMLNSLMWISNLAAMAWMPWVVLAVETALLERRLKPALVAALAGTMQMLSGAPEVILLTWALLGFLWIERVFSSPRDFKSLFGRFGLVVIIIAGLSAAQLLPFVDLLRHSQRETGFGDSTWSMPAWGWANFIVPLFRSYETTFGVYAQPGQFWVFSYYQGVATAVLAVLALWSVRRRRVWWLAALALLCLLLALGNNGGVYTFLRRAVPALGFMRYPIKFVTLPVFVLPLLAAFAIRDYVAPPNGGGPWHRRRAYIALFAAFAIQGVLTWAVREHPSDNVSWTVTARSALSRAGFLAAIFMTLLAWEKLSWSPLKKVAPFALAALFWFDLMTFAPRANPTVPRSAQVYAPNLPRTDDLKLDPPPKIGEARVMVSFEAARRMTYSTLANPQENYLYSRLSLIGNCNLLDGIPEVSGFFSTYFKEMGDVLQVLYGADTPPAGLMDFLAISHVTAPGRNISWTYRPSHLAWATAGQAPVIAGERETLAALGSTAFDPRRVVYLPPEATGQLTVTNAAIAQMRAAHFRAQHAQLTVEADSPAMVVIAQAYYHPWRAYVDGARVRIWRANHAFQAIEVPAGLHEVKLVYEDRWFQSGAAISLATLFAVGALWFWRDKTVLTSSPPTARASSNS